MINVFPHASDIINASATTTSTGIVTIPGGRWLTADIFISATFTGVGAANPKVTYTVPGGTTGAAPATGSILHQLSLTSLVGVAAVDSGMTEIIVYGGTNGCTIDFNIGGSSSASVTINGFLI